MGRVLTNNLSLSVAVEATPGVLPGSPLWKSLEPNNLTNYGTNISTIARSPISKNRQRRKGTITDLDSSVEFEHDLTLDAFNEFLEGFAFAQTTGQLYRPTAVTATGYTVASGGALANGLLVYARGFSTAANNGLKLLAGTSTGTEIKTTGLTAEASPPTNAIVEVTGVRGAAGDIRVNAQGNLISTTLNFTTLGLTVGQFIWVGGNLTANKFFNAANNGYARVEAIAANLLTLSKKSTTFVTDDGTSTGAGGTALLIDLHFGRFLRNVPVDNGSYLEKTFTFEAAYPNLQNPGPGDMYEYSKGCYCNELSFKLPLTDKATVTYGFIGLDTPVPTTIRATNAATAIQPLRTAALNTTADIARLRITEVDETGLTTDFKDVTLTVRNNVSPEKVIGQLGPKYVNAGVLEVDLESELLFTNYLVVDAIRANRQVTMDFAFKNVDGAVMIDIPAMTLNDGSKSYPVNESVRIKTTGQAFAHPTLNTSISASFFPYVPGV